jgi:hypothetical protein
VVTHLSVSDLMCFCSLLGQSKFESLRLFRDLNPEGVDTVLDMVANKNIPLDDCHTGCTHLTLNDIP